jgi:hypothetical protein
MQVRSEGETSVGTVAPVATDAADSATLEGTTPSSEPQEASGGAEPVVEAPARSDAVGEPKLAPGNTTIDFLSALVPEAEKPKEDASVAEAKRSESIVATGEAGAGAGRLGSEVDRKAELVNTASPLIGFTALMSFALSLSVFAWAGTVARVGNFFL